MKKQTLIAFALVITLAALGFGLINRDSPKEDLLAKATNSIPETDQNMVTKEFKIFSDFIYDIGPRFGPITKSEIGKITSIEAFLEDEVIQNMANLKSTSVILVVDDEESHIRAYGNSRDFTEAQLDILRNFDYSSSFVMRVDFTEKDKASGQLINNYRSPYHTIVPEEQARYSEGKESLKLFLKDQIQSELIGVNPEKLKPAKLYFTISENGILKNIRLDRDSGYPEVDKKMIELMSELPGTWSPAKNSNGEPVNQELVVSFGLMGC
ncbi:energy transducer TonB [Psychroserpens mesophilus]|uniref:energy transducer TonB n=1 Tax=Psychroserpens mesophilus TaxID=325473 RepID=UPI003F492934